MVSIPSIKHGYLNPKPSSFFWRMWHELTTELICMKQNMVHFEYIIPRKLRGNVLDQGCEPVCVAMGLTDMTMIVHRMHGCLDVQLSPGAIIDYGSDCVSQVILEVLTQENRGLQSVLDYPVKTKGVAEVGEIPYNVHGRHYWLYWVNWISNKRTMKWNFIVPNFSENGRKYPLVAAIKLGRLFDPKVAKKAYYGKPYKHHKSHVDSLKDEPDHLVLIVGVNTESEFVKDHYLVIKNSYGEEWGEGGLSKICFSMVSDLFMPVYSKEEWKQMKEEWKQMKSERKEMKRKRSKEGCSMRKKKQCFSE